MMICIRQILGMHQVDALYDQDDHDIELQDVSLDDMCQDGTSDDDQYDHGHQDDASCDDDPLDHEYQVDAWRSDTICGRLCKQHVISPQRSDRLSYVLIISPGMRYCYVVCNQSSEIRQVELCARNQFWDEVLLWRHVISPGNPRG